MSTSVYLDIFDYKREASYLLSSNEASEVFPLLVERIKSYYTRPVGSITEMRKRDLKTSVGTMWESFCVDWLMGKGTFTQVWTLKEWHEYCKVERVDDGLVLGKNDIGIDLIAKSESGYHAVQCKWRKKGKVTWTELSTFIALASRSGPWSSHIIMTNGDGILWKVRRTKKEVSMCKGTFNATSREHWLAITGVSGQGHRLSDEPIAEQKKVEEVVDLDAMREARLARFAKVTK